MMGTTTAAVISLRGLSTNSSFFGTDSEHQLVPVQISSSIPSKNHFTIVARKSSNLNGTRAKIKAIKAVKEYVHTPTSTTEDEEEGNYDSTLELESSLKAVILLQKSMLEKQWKLPFDFDRLDSVKLKPIIIQDDLQENKQQHDDDDDDDVIIRSGTNPRQRRSILKRKYNNIKGTNDKKRYTVNPNLIHNKSKKGYLRKGIYTQDNLLTHDKVIFLSKKIKDGLLLDKHRKKLKEKMGIEPSDRQVAHYLRISCKELRIRVLESSLAKEKLAMSNVGLVKSIAQKYDNMGVDMDDLIQGGLLGLLKGIERFDAAKGCRISTYVYWWIRQGVTRTFVETAGLMKLPFYMRERLSMIKNAKISLEQQGITPTIQKIAEYLNISEKKVRNATEMQALKVYSLDREVFPSYDGASGYTLHNYIQDKNPENDPWHAYQECSIRNEVNKLLNTEINEREREIICLYYGIGCESLSWTDIGKTYGLSRERVRQVGLVAMEKLKNAAKKKELGKF